jgi:hypothetical protein
MVDTLVWLLPQAVVVTVAHALSVLRLSNHLPKVTLISLGISGVLISTSPFSGGFL